MPDIYAQDRLRQRPPESKPAQDSAVGSRGRVVNDTEKLHRAQSDARDALLTKLWAHKPKMSGDELCRRLGYANRGSVYAAARRLGLPARSDETRPLCEKRDAIIRECWPDRSITTEDIAARCGFQFAQSVTTRARKLGLPARPRGMVRG